MEVAHVRSVPGKPHLEEVELADGRVYQLQRARNKTGYFCVVEGRPNEYHAKPKVNGIGQVTLPAEEAEAEAEAAAPREQAQTPLGVTDAPPMLNSPSPVALAAPYQFEPPTAPFVATPETVALVQRLKAQGCL